MFRLKAISNKVRVQCNKPPANHIKKTENIERDITHLFSIASANASNNTLAAAIGHAWETSDKKPPVNFEYEGFNIEIRKNGDLSFVAIIKKNEQEHLFEVHFDNPDRFSQYISAMHRFSKIKQLNPELEINFKTCERCTANEKCGTNGTLKQAHEAPKIGLDLSHAELRRANLSGLDLQYTEMHHAQLTNAKLIGTNLTSANLNSASFTDSTLVNVNMRDTDLRLSGFDNSHITDVDMTNAQLDNVTIANTTSTNLTLAGATLNDGWITTSSFKNANFSGAQLERTSFMLTNLDDANLQSSNLTQTTFAFVSMDRTDFRKTHLQRANIRAKECQQWDRALLEPSSQFQLDRARFNPLDLPARSVNVLREGLQQFENNRTRNSANKPAMAGNDNLLYLQYTLQAMRQRTDPALQQRATDIYCNQYLKQNNVALHTQSALFEPPESSLPLPEDGLNIVLMGRSGGALICSPETYHKMITGEESDAWNNIGVQI